MGQVQQQKHVLDQCAFVWIDLPKEPSLSVAHSISGVFEFRTVREPQHITRTIGLHTPPFICVELEEGSDADPKSIEMLTRVREVYPDLPTLIVAGQCSFVVALWAVRLHVWDVMIKPVSASDLCRTIDALTSRLQRRALLQASTARLERAGSRQDAMRTSSALSYVASHYADRILISEVAAQCRLSPSQFCRTFRNEHHLSFGRYLLRFRMERARERLCLPDMLVKEVAYEVGFNDLSYFTRSFRREFGMCPSEFQAGATTQQTSPMAA